MLYVSETWCLTENEMVNFRRTKRAMVRAMCGTKTDGEKEDRGLEMLGLKETGSDGKSKGSEMVQDDGHLLRKVLEFEVKFKRKGGQTKKAWKMQVEKESNSVDLVFLIFISSFFAIIHSGFC